MKSFFKALAAPFARPLLRRMHQDLAAQVAAVRRDLAVQAATLEKTLQLAALARVDRVRQLGPGARLADAEFSVSSQWGEDGILQYLLAQVPIADPSFVEFGVEDYTEANTRFLLQHDHWRGLIIDADPRLAEIIAGQSIGWRHDLTVRSSFITAENINPLIGDAGFRGDIGLLSVDIDGNDYWVWRAIDVISPRIVVCEYNSVFGPRHRLTVPYRPDFTKTAHHASDLCFGASLPALVALAEEKGYVFAGSNSAGCNAFFVRRDVATGIRAVTVEEGYVESRFRSSRDADGRLTFLSGAARAHAIRDAIVHDLSTGRAVRFGDLPAS